MTEWIRGAHPFNRLGKSVTKVMPYSYPPRHWRFRLRQRNTVMPACQRASLPDRLTGPRPACTMASRAGKNHGRAVTA
jgi:hypothetical protein